jgi:hypothetical protein
MICLVAKVDDNWLWHKRFCHINFDSIVKTSSMLAVRDLPKIVKPTNTICKECVLAKYTRTSFPARSLLLKQSWRLYIQILVVLRRLKDSMVKGI